jgi:hypothetical protein
MDTNIHSAPKILEGGASADHVTSRHARGSVVTRGRGASNFYAGVRQLLRVDLFEHLVGHVEYDTVAYANSYALTSSSTSSDTSKLA